MDWLLNLRAVKGRAYPRAVGGLREPSWMFFDTLLPLLGIAAFVFYYQALGAPEVYTGYVIIGGAMTAYWLNVLWSMATQFYWEKETGNLELYMMAPMSKMSVLAGMALGGMILTSVRAVSTIVLGVIIFQVEMDISSPGLLAAVFVTTLIALYGLGMLFSSLYMLWGRGAWHMSNLMQEPIYLVSGFYFPGAGDRLLLRPGSGDHPDHAGAGRHAPVAVRRPDPGAAAGDHRAGVVAGVGGGLHHGRALTPSRRWSTWAGRRGG